MSWIEQYIENYTNISLKEANFHLRTPSMHQRWRRTSITSIDIPLSKNTLRCNSIVSNNIYFDIFFGSPDIYTSRVWLARTVHRQCSMPKLKSDELNCRENLWKRCDFSFRLGQLFRSSKWKKKRKKKKTISYSKRVVIADIYSSMEAGAPSLDKQPTEKISNFLFRKRIAPRHTRADKS